MKKLDSSLFTWQRWRAGSISDFNIPCREEYIIKNAYVLRKYLVGYCNGFELMCRNKPKYKAVMFFYNNIHFWFHITEREFKAL